MLRAFESLNQLLDVVITETDGHPEFAWFNDERLSRRVVRGHQS